MTRMDSCVECGTMHLPTTWIVGSACLCDSCASRLHWHLEEARQLGALVGLDLEQLRQAVHRG
jgi:hypothetical protein